MAPEGAETRPTADRARETLFSMLTSRLGTFEGLNVADLFAGTGALGLEALSRGAAHAIFVETDRSALAAIKTNIAKLGATDKTIVLSRSAETPGTTPMACDLVLLDPPYGKGLGDRALAGLRSGGWLAPGAWISVETVRGETLAPEGYTVDAVRDVGKARLHLLRPV
ncbi:16S rRNA (guanine966-N2)-methyltransferase [Sphingosinicella soli]|uniref:16S rRNA (Guanine966-N2)-methyltransferase n=1 Tax=Sphingosinicella soli TaxID=333708 RepID=A0A7W7FA60_9SPHN|nr:16S rRNA (guanine966-N2)-methyltransferase [Sphingosinicella soli]